MISESIQNIESGEPFMKYVSGLSIGGVVMMSAGCGKQIRV
jgi:hypothetical protein